MEERGNLLSFLAKALFLGGIIIAGVYFIPWQEIKWGKVQILGAKTVTAVGQARKEEKTQIATFTAGVSAVNDSKDTAVGEVNAKMADIINSIKGFGIADADIKTQNMSVYQAEETYYEEGRQKTRPGQWRINNYIEIKLRDVGRASALASLLTKSGATSVNGPSFSLDNMDEVEGSLLSSAIDDARKKAQVMASSSGKELGEIISVAEGGQASQTFFSSGADIGGGGGMQPGTSTVGKTVTVVFELK